MKRIFFTFIYFFCLTATAFAQPKYGGQLVLAATSDPKSFNEILAKETTSTEILKYLYEGLTTTNAQTAQVEPQLAERWIVDGTGLIWTFFLRKNLKWSDGVPLTADDVVFTFQDLIYNPDIPSSASDIFTIEGKKFEVKKIDDHTVQFILPTKFAPFLRGMSQAILPKHKLEESVKKGTFNFKWGIDSDPQDVVGSGPFKLAKYDPGQRIVLERNSLYWKKDDQGNALPYLDRIIYMIIQNSDVGLLKFLDGELDYVGVRPSDYPILKPKEENDGDFTIYELGPGFGTRFVVFNQNQGVNPKTNKPFLDPVKLSWFSDVNFRRAVAHSIDREKIIEIVMTGFGYPQYSAMSPSAGFYHNPNVTKYKYDLDEARKILSDAGYQDRDGDGVIEDKSGNPVEFNLNTNAGSPEGDQIAAIIRHDLQELGMKVNFLTLEFNNLVSKLTATFDWDAIIIGLTGGVEPHFGKNVWHSSGGLHMWYPGQKEPATDWEKRIDEIFDQGVQELDEKKRQALYHEHQQIVSQQQPMIYTVLGSRMSAFRNKFENVKPYKYGGVLHNPEEIYIK